MSAKSPLVTIITAVYNCEKHIRQCIESVIAQKYNNIEYIVIDGGSSDKTVEIIKEYNDKIHYWVSEPDSGIGDAWNKGIKQASGQIIGLLNADDYYDLSTVQKVVDQIVDYDVPLLTYGVTNVIDEHGHAVSTNDQIFDPERLNTGFLFLHTSCFVTRRTYELIGLFDTSSRIAVDTDWLVRAYRAGVEFKKIDTLNYMRTGGISDRLTLRAFREYMGVLKKHRFSLPYIYKGYLKVIINLFLARTLGSTRSEQLKSQVVFIIIAALNFVYNRLPFFFLKKLFARLIGIRIGKNSYIHTPVRFFTWGKIVIGDNTVVNSGCYLDNRCGLQIGSNVNISHDSKLYTLGHDIDDPFFRLEGAGIAICDDAVLFANTLVMPGVTIGRGAVVYPGSVVVKSIDPLCVVGGNPAKVLRKRSGDIKYKLDYGYWFAI